MANKQLKYTASEIDERLTKVGELEEKVPYLEDPTESETVDIPDILEAIEKKQDILTDDDKQAIADLHEDAVISVNGLTGAITDVFRTVGSIETSTDLTTLDVGLWKVDDVAHTDFPDATQNYYGSLIQCPGSYKAQILCAGVNGKGGLYSRRYYTGTKKWSDWSDIDKWTNYTVVTADTDIDSLANGIYTISDIENSTFPTTGKMMGTLIQTAGDINSQIIIGGVGNTSLWVRRRANTTTWGAWKNLTEEAFTEEYKAKVDEMYADWTETDTALTDLEGTL